jgi:hypothetical protein
MDKKFKILVVKFLENELSDSEQKKFEKYLLDPECQAYLEKAKRADIIIREGFQSLLEMENLKNKKKSFKDEYREMFGEDENFDQIEADIEEFGKDISLETHLEVHRWHNEMLASRRKTKALYYRIISFSIGLAATVFGFAYFLGIIQTPTLNSLYSCYYKPNSIILTRHIEKGNTQKIKLYNAYISADYAKCAEYCQIMLATDTTDEDVMFTYGICLMEMDSARAAIQQFNRAETAVGVNDGILFVLASWYRSLCYLDLRDKESALRELRRLNESDNGFKGIVRGEELEGRMK